MAEPTTTIRIKRSTKQILEALGTKGDTFDSIIRRLINNYLEEE